jgi:hypothetical protein
LFGGAGFFAFVSAPGAGLRRLGGEPAGLPYLAGRGQPPPAPPGYEVLGELGHWRPPGAAGPRPSGECWLDTLQLAPEARTRFAPG